jgi:beta-N-acetylhexosaminidase
LREQLGYHGLVVSDAMGMQAISTHYGLEQAMEMAVLAGVDMLLSTRNLDSAGRSLPRGIVEFLARRVAEGAIPESRINEAYARIMSLKQRYLTAVHQQAVAAFPGDLDITNYPNPFNSSTTIRFSLPREGTISLTVYDLLGRVVTRVAHSDFARGVYEFRLDAPVASGVYLCRLEAVGTGRDTWSASKTHRMLVLR